LLLQNYPELHLFRLISGIFFFILLRAEGKSFDPPAGMPGSKAISHDSPLIKGWAGSVRSLERGLVNVSDPGSGFASSGTAGNTLGPAMENGVLSLGDGGSIVLGFPAPLSDGPGPDFAVFENGFSDGFLELAMVEVSSNGQDFFSFPCYSETQTMVQTGPFDTLDARNLSNLAGKYRAGFGTGFDLQELQGRPGLDVSQVLFIRIRDVVGSLDPVYGTADNLGRMINDPWPTPFESGGFDLDAVGVLHFQQSGLPLVWPSVLNPGASFSVMGREDSVGFYLFEANGHRLMEIPAGNRQPVKLPDWIGPGVYFLKDQNGRECRKILVK
jgi:hypothetical protein